MMSRLTWSTSIDYDSWAISLSVLSMLFFTNFGMGGLVPPACLLRKIHQCTLEMQQRWM